MSIDFLKSLYYEVLSYFVPQKQNYKITGKCRKCGKCCKEIRAYGLKNEKNLQIMRFIFPWYRMFYITGRDNNNEIILSCKFLSSNGKCKIYPFRPLLCRNYPAKSINFNTEMIDGCGFEVVKKQFKDYL